jgi:uncharacterized protein
MKFTKYAFFTLILAFVACSSVDSGSQKKNLLWKVESGGNVVYLLGSIHIADESLYPLDTVIIESFEECAYLVLELDPSAHSALDIYKYMSYEGDTLLKNMITAEQYAKIKEYMDKHNVPEMAFGSFKPWAAVMTLQSLEMLSNGFSQHEGIDMHFLERAKSSGKMVKELESLEFQMSAMNKLNAYTGEYLDYTLAELEDTKKYVKELIDAWKQGDSDMIYKISQEGNQHEGFEQVMEDLNYSRNVTMTQKIEEYIASGEKHFIVVGALHLLGERGIVQLLKSKNKYKIKQL